jgi:hypothetical protein
MELLLQLFGRLGIVIEFFHTLVHEIDSTDA